jgi:hypothetical protein
MRLLLISDTHGKLGIINELVAQVRADARKKELIWTLYPKKMDSVRYETQSCEILLIGES